MRRFLQYCFLVCFVLAGRLAQAQQVSGNTVNYKVTYDVVTDRYTAWVVPLYNVPNTSAPVNSTAQTEFGGTAQFTLKVPASFVLSNIQDITGNWDKSPLQLGPGITGQSWPGLDPAYNYFVIGKSATETDYGSFKAGVPVALFTFTGNGCFGPVIPLPAGDAFIAEASSLASLNVANSFYSRSGQPAGGNVAPLEQFVNITGTPADCRPTSAVADSGTLTAGTSATIVVLSNDTNKGDPASTANVTVSISGQPTNGTATANSDGTISYKPAPGFSGVVSFTYTICDRVALTTCSSAPVSLTVLPSNGTANLKIQKIASKPTSQTASLGEVVQFTVVVTNLGPSVATNVIVADTIPTGTQLINATASQGSYSAASSQWTIGSVSANASVTLVMQVKLSIEGVTYSKASISHVDQIDPVLTNNLASACVSVPLVLCQDEQLNISIPSGYQNVRWFRDGQVIANATGNSILVSMAGTYTFDSISNSCPITGCCPVVVVAGTCCKPICIPLVVTKVKKR